MKHRQGLRIVAGTRSSLGRPIQPRTALPSDISRERNRLLADFSHRQIASTIASALTASEQRLSALLHDRARIGRELHDSVLPALYAIGISLAQHPERHAGMPLIHQPATDQLDQLIQNIRRMILSVESGNVTPFSFSVELQALAGTFGQIRPLQIQIKIDRTAEERLTGEEARELITIAREALSNCIRHSGATRITIALRRIGTRVQLRIRDNGTGFEAAQRELKGIGFAQMEERARRIGGCLEIQSTIGRGTCIKTDLCLAPILTTA